MECLHTIPASDGFSMPAEFSPHYGTLMIWPQRPGSFGRNTEAAENAFCQIIREIAKGELMFVLAGKEVYSRAEEKLYAGLSDDEKKQIRLILWETDDAWARDTGATFVTSKTELRGIDWQFNAWGGSYDGLYASWEKDQTVAGKICEEAGAKVYDARSFVLEGGSIHSDGEGTLLTTAECLLSPGRNPGLTKEQIEEKLENYLGIKKIIWIPEGIFQDETNGHVDNMCAFTAPGEVILAWTDNESDPQYARSMEAYRVLEAATDAKGRKLKIHKLPIPAVPQTIREEDLPNFVFEEGEDEREAGERLAASYINFYIANSGILVPQFGDVNDKPALEILSECFPGRRIIPIPARDILLGGGNIHCITQQIPQV